MLFKAIGVTLRTTVNPAEDLLIAAHQVALGGAVLVRVLVRCRHAGD